MKALKKTTNSALLQVRMDKNTKTEADAVFAKLGLDTPTAVRMFLAQTLLHQGLPFAVEQPRYNFETERAIEYAKKGKGLSKTYKTAKEAFTDILDENYA